MINPSFKFSLRLLTHPLSLFACSILLLNDLFLKPLFPSFLTGKLSDLAGLFLLPFLVGTFLSLVSPLFKLSDQFVRALSLLIPGVVFTLAKTLPSFTQFLTQELAMRIVLDFSDLLALPVLALSAFLWHHLASHPVPHRAWQLLALPLVLTAILGDMAAPDYGISCLQLQKSTLHTASLLNQRYASTDGGFTWQKDASESSPICQYGAQIELPAQFSDSSRGILYKIPSRTLIQVSTDSGQSWKDEPLDAGISEAEWQFIRVRAAGNPMLENGILNAVLDPSTGNLVLAMGHEGILVRAPSGTYTWVDVGTYRHRSLARSGFEGYATLLTSPLLLSLLIALLAMRAWTLKRDTTPWQIVLTVIAWILVLLFDLSILPGLIPYQSLSATVSISIFAVAALYLLVVNAVAFSRMGTESRWWIRLIPRALLISLGSFLFFGAWSLNWIQSYLLAAILSLAWIIFAISYTSSRIPEKIQA